MNRLDAERAAEAEAAARPRPVWDWRSLFRPRSLAFAAATLVIALAVPRVSQIAGLGPGLPHGGSAHMEHTSLQTMRVEWIPCGPRGGTLFARLRAKPLPGGRVNTLFCEVKAPGVKGIAAQTTISSDKETDIKVPLDSLPEHSELSVTLIPTEGDETQEQTTLEVPVTSEPDGNLSPAP